MVIQKYSKKGNIIRYNKNNGNNRNISMFGGGPAPNQQLGLNAPDGIAINNTGYVFVADRDNHCIHIFSPLPDYIHIHTLGILGSIGNTNNTFNHPCGLAIENDILYVADIDNHRIQIFRIYINDNNTITATHLPGRNGGPHSIGTGIEGNTNNTFANPQGLAIENNILYVVDAFNNRIQVFNSDLTNPATLQYYDTIPPPPPKYTILTQNRVIPLDIRNTRCILCNFPLCTPIPHNPNNNVNGYVVRLNTARLRYFHYTCVYNYITNHRTVDISQFGISHRDTNRLINDNRYNNNFEGTDFFIPDFIILQREIDVPANFRDTPCRLCRFPLCSRAIDTTNNLNGYIVHLHNLTNPNTYYYHYKCISKYFIQIIGTDSPYKSPHCVTIIDRHDIDKLLNIDRKADVVNGNGFYQI